MAHVFRPRPNAGGADRDNPFPPQPLVARSCDLNFRVTSTLTQTDQIGLPQLLPWELQAIRPIWAKIAVRVVVKRPRLFTTLADCLEQLCGKRVQKRWSR